jgi:16S rRNA (guanine(966)-N(2))-methyltransferase RsmD
LDLFSGSGAIGLEALSRGAQKAVFVDSGAQSVSVIKTNVESARLAQKAEIMKCDVVSAIERLAQKGEKFDVIFMDPPYNKGLADMAVKKIAECGLLAEDGFIVAEQSQEEEAPQAKGLEVYRTKDYKITKMTFIRYEEV